MYQARIDRVLQAMKAMGLEQMIVPTRTAFGISQAIMSIPLSGCLRCICGQTVPTSCS